MSAGPRSAEQAADAPPHDDARDRRLAFIGPMTGHLPGQVVTQCETLVRLFSEAGCRVIAASRARNRYVRALDEIATLLLRGPVIDVQCLQVFGGPIFLVEDVASWLGRLWGHRIVMVLRGGLMPEFMARYPRWTVRVLRRADVLVAPSTFLARELAVHGLHVEVVPNVIDLTAYPFRPRRELAPRLLWLRTFHEIYNPELAVRALARLRVVRPGATLIMGGQDKGLLAATKQLADDLGVAGAIEFPGYLSFAEKVGAAERSDIFLNTNRADNMPVTVVEAAAMGLPVVATAVGGIPDLLAEGETGLMVPDDDTEATVQAILRLLEDPELAARLSHGGRQLAEASSWERVRPRWERLFQPTPNARFQESR